VNNRVGADLQFQEASLLREDDSVGLPLNFSDRVSRCPLRVRGWKNYGEEGNEEK
jgi:hypothetical protein